MTEMIKTNNYELFSFRDDNRHKIDNDHVERLKKSITENNLLEHSPIIVNEDYEILDGQHRFEACKRLGIYFYYTITKLESSDILTLNVNKKWTLEDYLNYYCKHNFPEYIKFNEFIKSKNLRITIGLAIVMGDGKISRKDFQDGNFKFLCEQSEENIDACFETIGLIEKLNGYSVYTKTSRFWKPLLKMFNSEDFNKEKWMINLSKNISKFSPRARERDYYDLMIQVHNKNNSNKIYDEKEF